MPTLSNTICVKCRIEMRCTKTGEMVEELDDAGFPYKKWGCDRFACPSCGHEVFVNFGRQPIAEHYQPDYKRWQTNVSFGARNLSAQHAEAGK